MLNIESCRDLFIVEGGFGNCAVNVTDRYGKPVDFGFIYKAFSFLGGGESFAGFEQLFVWRQWAFFVSEYCSEFGFDRDACFMGQLNNLSC